MEEKLSIFSSTGEIEFRTKNENGSRQNFKGTMENLNTQELQGMINMLDTIKAEAQRVLDLKSMRG